MFQLIANSVTTTTYSPFNIRTADRAKTLAPTTSGGNPYYIPKDMPYVYISSSLSASIGLIGCDWI